MKEYLNLRPPYGIVKNVHYMLKISYAGCPGPSPDILAQFTLKMFVAARNREKFTKNLF